MDYEVVKGEPFTGALEPNSFNICTRQAARLATCQHLKQIIGAELTLDINASAAASGYARAFRFIISAVAGHRDQVWGSPGRRVNVGRASASPLASFPLSWNDPSPRSMLGEASRSMAPVGRAR